MLYSLILYFVFSLLWLNAIRTFNIVIDEKLLRQKESYQTFHSLKHVTIWELALNVTNQTKIV